MFSLKSVSQTWQNSFWPGRAASVFGLRKANKQQILYCSHTFSTFHEKRDNILEKNEQSVKSVSKHAYA
jgi:hypothetical protein